MCPLLVKFKNASGTNVLPCRGIIYKELSAGIFNLTLCIERTRGHEEMEITVDKKPRAAIEGLENALTKNSIKFFDLTPYQ